MSEQAPTSNSVADVSTTGFDTLTPSSDSLIGLAAVGKVGLALALILGVIVLGSWLIRRLGPNSTRAGRGVKVISSAAVGQRERVVIVEVEDTWLVLGVGGGQVNKLHDLKAPSTAPTPSADKASSGAGTPATSDVASSRDGDQGFAERFASALRHNTGSMLKGRGGRGDS
ncbi:flagellar biosynthetic protein FliO [Halomonas salinarum]|uniref:flagellar biosynthetic protein FliO n=1 Tax=Halomonas salinarum TaxID=1158993 RepID=UPI001439EAED|nr:flagellar biosynthetic protein FliO [Halomonas salinarum]